IYQIVPLPDYVQAWVDAECEVIRHSGGRATRADLAEHLPKAVGLLTHNQLKIDHELLLANPQLRAISSMGVGYDYIDVPFATEHGVLVCNTANVSTDSVADLTFGLVLGVARRIVQADSYVKSGSWARQGQMRPLATDLRGTTLGLLGLGRIGQAVAR